MTKYREILMTGTAQEYPQTIKKHDRILPFGPTKLHKKGPRNIFL